MSDTDPLDLVLEDMFWSARELSLFGRLGVRTVRDLVNTDLSVAIGARGCGRITLRQIRYDLLDLGLHLKGDEEWFDAAAKNKAYSDACHARWKAEQEGIEKAKVNALVATAVTAEREACAKVVDDFQDRAGISDRLFEKLAAAIRSRGEAPQCSHPGFPPPGQWYTGDRVCCRGCNSELVFDGTSWVVTLY